MNIKILQKLSEKDQQSALNDQILEIDRPNNFAVSNAQNSLEPANEEYKLEDTSINIETCVRPLVNDWKSKLMRKSKNTAEKY